MNTSFNPGDMVRFGWNTFKSRGWYFVGAYLFGVLAYNGVERMIASATGTNAQDVQFGALYLVGLLLSFGISSLSTMGFTWFALRAHDNSQTVTLHDLWHPRPFWLFVGANLLTVICVVGGFFLFIIPCFIVAVMLMFVPYIVLEKNVGPIAALQESRRVTKGHLWNLFIFALLLVGLNFLGILALGVGLLVSMPVSMLATVHAYRTLEAMSMSEQPTA